MKNNWIIVIVFSMLGINQGLSQNLLNETSSFIWSKTGASPNQYEMGGNPFSGSDIDAGFVKSKADNPEGFGTWLTSSKADEFLGKRIKLSVKLKSVGVEKGASMWMRVDSKDGMLSFDNMLNRELKNDNDWSSYDIVLDVPEKSERIYFGVMLNGKGEVLAKDLKFQIVDVSHPVTDMTLFYQYLNTADFEKLLPFLENYLKYANTNEYLSFYYYISLMEIGKVDEAKKYIHEYSMKAQPGNWVSLIGKYLSGSLNDEELLLAAENLDRNIENTRKCEAYFYVGIRNKYEHKSAKAKEYFNKCIATNETRNIEYLWSKAELKKLR